MNINNIKKWLSDSDKIKNVKANFKRSTSSSNVDKFQLGFNADHRFKSFSATVYFGGYTGDYGDSSVYNFLSLGDADVAKEAVIQYMKDNEDDLLLYISEFYKSKAIESKDKAKSLLEADLNVIKELEQGASK